jgi:hypothetical protein
LRGPGAVFSKRAPGRRRQKKIIVWPGFIGLMDYQDFQEQVIFCLSRMALNYSANAPIKVLRTMLLLFLDRWNIKVFTNLLCKPVINFLMPRNGGSFSIPRVPINSMVSSFPEELTVILF